MRQVIVSEENRQAVASSKILRGALPPPDRVNGPVRMIEIEGVDINACGGCASPHLHSWQCLHQCQHTLVFVSCQYQQAVSLVHNLA